MTQQPAATPHIRSTATRRAWTSREEAYLREHYRAQTVATLAARLGRTGMAVESKIRQLGLHKRLLVDEQAITGEFYRPSAVASGLGVDESRVLAWIKTRKLPAQARGTWISGDDLAAFLRAHPAAVDLAHMTAEQRRWANALMSNRGVSA